MPAAARETPSAESSEASLSSVSGVESAIALCVGYPGILGERKKRLGVVMSSRVLCDEWL